MKLLLSYKFKIIGLICVCCAIIVYTVHLIQSAQINLSALSVSSNNFTMDSFPVSRIMEKLILLLFISGFSLIIFSKEKKEINGLKSVRTKAIFNTTYVFIIWLLLSILFFYESNLHSIIIPAIILSFLIYLVFFYSLKNKMLKKRRLKRVQHKLLKSYLAYETE